MGAGGMWARRLEEEQEEEEGSCLLRMQERPSVPGGLEGMLGAPREEGMWQVPGRLRPPRPDPLPLGRRRRQGAVEAAVGTRGPGPS